MAHSPDANSNALLGYGTIMQVESLDSPGVWLDLDEIYNVTPPSSEVDQIDVTHMRSPGRRREFIDGLIDSGQAEFEMNYVPGSTSDTILLGIANTPLGQQRRRNWRIIYPTAAPQPMDTFSGNLQSYVPDLPTDDKMTATVTIQVTGSIARGAFS